MFDRISPRYDHLNRVLSFGADLAWRRRATALARLDPGARALDVGAGTGDLAFAILGASEAGARVTAVDLSPAMLGLFAARAARLGVAARADAVVGSAQRLPFPDAAFERVVAGFAVRNFGDLGAGLAELRRVLRPGGRAVLLELSTPPNAAVRALYRLYFHHLAPLVAIALGGDARAYRYLPTSVARFPGAEAFADLLRGAGFRAVRFERLTFGIAAIHVGEV